MEMERWVGLGIIGTISSTSALALRSNERELSRRRRDEKGEGNSKSSGCFGANNQPQIRIFTTESS